MILKKPTGNFFCVDGPMWLQDNGMTSNPASAINIFSSAR